PAVHAGPGAAKEGARRQPASALRVHRLSAWRKRFLRAALFALLVVVAVLVTNELATRASYRFDASWDAESTRVAIPYERGRRGEVLLPAQIDGSDAGVCDLDTGT